MDTENKPLGAGDVVTLKSGGSAMTIEGMEAPPNHLATRQLPGAQMARCVWMDETGAIGERLIWPHLLVVKAQDRDDSHGNFERGFQRGPVYPGAQAGALRQFQGLHTTNDAQAQAELAADQQATAETDDQSAALVD